MHGKRNKLKSFFETKGRWNCSKKLVIKKIKDQTKKEMKKWGEMGTWWTKTRSDQIKDGSKKFVRKNNTKMQLHCTLHTLGDFLNWFRKSLHRFAALNPKSPFC